MLKKAALNCRTSCVPCAAHDVRRPLDQKPGHSGEVFERTCHQPRNDYHQHRAREKRKRPATSTCGQCDRSSALQVQRISERPTAMEMSPLRRDPRWLREIEHFPASPQQVLGDAGSALDCFARLACTSGASVLATYGRRSEKSLSTPAG